MGRLQFVIVTGMSGAGKSTAMKMMEDMGFFCIDNLPIPLLDKLVDFTTNFHTKVERIAIGIDSRSGEHLQTVEGMLDVLAQKDVKYEILFLDAEDNYIIDTSRLLTRELKSELERIFIHDEEFKSLFVTVLSFGFKYGIPADADIVMDVRFLPNPYYVEGLRAKTGNDVEIQQYVMQFEETKIFLDKLEDLIKFLIPNYISEGKNQLVIAIGCTGGKHRSVTLANELYKRLDGNSEYGLKIEHRDIGKDALRGK